MENTNIEVKEDSYIINIGTFEQMRNVNVEELIDKVNSTINDKDARVKIVEMDNMMMIPFVQINLFIKQGVSDEISSKVFELVTETSKRFINESL